MLALPINFNDQVLVRLTPYGRAYHAAQHAIFNAKTGRSEPYEAPKEDKDGFSKWQLWSLAHEFGEELWNGNREAPFDMNMILITKMPKTERPTSEG